MNDKRIADLMENYEDAVMALIMDQYAEESGRKVLKEFEDAEACGDIPDMPSELDKKCRKMIRRTYAKQHFHTQLKAITKATGRVASIALVVLGLCSTLILSADSLQTPVRDFIITQYKKYSTITSNQNSTISTKPVETTGSIDRSQSPLAGMIPEDYCLYQFSSKGKHGFTCAYINNQEHLIELSTSNPNGAHNVDTEDAEVYDVIIGEAAGIMIVKNGYTMVWKDPTTEMLFILCATHLDVGEFWSLAEDVAECPDWAEIILGD